MRVAAQVVRLLDERAPREMSMAVIAMYAEQVERLRQALGRRRFKRPVKIDTVDSFEGREEDMVVISLVRSNERGRIGFLRVPNRLNVAISRAKHLVACIGDSATLRAGEELMYGELVEAARSTGGWLSALDIVSPGKPQRHRRGGASVPARLGEDGQPLPAADGEGEEGAARRRRRRRRRGSGQAPAVPRVPGEPGQVAAGGGPAQLGPDGEPLRRRRRRRRRGRGPATGAPVAGATAPVDGAAVPGSLHFAPGETQSFRPRRRRRRRGGGGGGGPQGAPGQGSEGGAASIELPPAATG